MARLKADPKFKDTGVTALATDWRVVKDWIGKNAGLLGGSFTHYLEMEHVVVEPVAAKPLGENPDLEILRKAANTRNSWWQLFEGVRERLSRLWELSKEVSRPKQKPWSDCPTFNLNFTPTVQDSGWPRGPSEEAPHAWLELRLPEPNDSLEFRCGLTLVDRGRSVVESFDLETLGLVGRHLASHAGEFEKTESEDRGTLARAELVYPISCLPASPIEGQILTLAEWAEGVFEAIPLNEVRLLGANR